MFASNKLGIGLGGKILRELTNGPYCFAVDCEKTVYDDDLLVAATYDVMAESNQEKMILELKSSKAVQKSHKMQAAFQAKNAGIKKAYVVALTAPTKKGYSICTVDVEKEYADFVKICNGQSIL